jgi:hypothetical protein
MNAVNIHHQINNKTQLWEIRYNLHYLNSNRIIQWNNSGDGDHFKNLVNIK